MREAFWQRTVIDLKNGYSIAAHIKLTGQFIYRGPETKNILPSKKYVKDLPSSAMRLIFILDNNARLFFNDFRRFAWVKLVKTKDLDTIPFFKELGPKPFKDLTYEYFKIVLNKLKSSVKALLMDQKKIGGIGNIYTNDALNLAKIDPRRKAASLNDIEIKKLYK